MSAFWEGVLAGYGIAIPVGAIAILIIDSGLRRGFAIGFMAGSGAAAADLIYASLAAVAGEALAAFLAPYTLILQIISALVLLVIGGAGLWRARVQAPRRRSISPHKTQGRLGTFAQFFGLTLLNPLTIAYFAALILGRETGSAEGFAGRVAFVAGAGLASWSWQTVLAGSAAVAGQRMSLHMQRATTVVGNLIVCGFGLRIAVLLLTE